MVQSRLDHGKSHPKSQSVQSKLKFTDFTRSKSKLMNEQVEAKKIPPKSFDLPEQKRPPAHITAYTSQLVEEHETVFKEITY